MLSVRSAEKSSPSLSWGGRRSGEETRFSGCEEFNLTKPFLLFSKTTRGDDKACLQGAWSPCDESKSSPSFQYESGQAETRKCVSRLSANVSAASLTPVLASHLELVKTHLFLEKALLLAATIHWKRCFWKLPLSPIYNPHLMREGWAPQIMHRFKWKITRLAFRAVIFLFLTKRCFSSSAAPFCQVQRGGELYHLVKASKI